MGTSGCNRFDLTASIAELGAVRYTPAGLVALDLHLMHESQQFEAGRNRQVKARIRAVAFGTVAERLMSQSMGSVWRFSGFLASSPTGKRLVFHVQDFQQN